MEDAEEEKSRPDSLVSTSIALFNHQNNRGRVPITSDLTTRSQSRKFTYQIGCHLHFVIVFGVKPYLWTISVLQEKKLMVTIGPSSLLYYPENIQRTKERSWLRLTLQANERKAILFFSTSA